jgi:SHS2 domain-containing protein
LTYRFLEHTADVGVEVTSPSLPEAYAEAGLALFEIMTRTEDFKPRRSMDLSASGQDLISLLYQWLEELIFAFDTRGMVLVKFDVLAFSEDEPSIRARGWGEEFDPGLHVSRTGVKAITYHRMEVRLSEGLHVLRYFVDI